MIGNGCFFGLVERDSGCDVGVCLRWSRVQTELYYIVSLEWNSWREPCWESRAMEVLLYLTPIPVMDRSRMKSCLVIIIISTLWMDGWIYVLSNPIWSSFRLIDLTIRFFTSNSSSHNLFIQNLKYDVTLILNTALVWVHVRFILGSLGRYQPLRNFDHHLTIHRPRTPWLPKEKRRDHWKHGT